LRGGLVPAGDSGPAGSRGRGLGRGITVWLRLRRDRRWPRRRGGGGKRRSPPVRGARLAQPTGGHRPPRGRGPGGTSNARPGRGGGDGGGGGGGGEGGGRGGAGGKVPTGEEPGVIKTPPPPRRNLEFLPRYPAAAPVFGPQGSLEASLTCTLSPSLKWLRRRF